MLQPPRETMSLPNRLASLRSVVRPCRITSGVRLVAGIAVKGAHQRVAEPIARRPVLR